MHLLDANVLIDAARDYYGFDRVPEFWSWMEYKGAAGLIKIVQENYEEIIDGGDGLADWLRTDSVKTALLLDEEADQPLVERIICEGYAPDLRDDELPRLGRDPFLAAYALVDASNRWVVTTEASRPTRIRANRHLPDVCRTLGLRCCNTFELTRTLDFRTSWRG